MPAGLQNLQHIVVLMLENRSFDHLLGFLYSDRDPPQHFLPAGSQAPFNGVPLSFSNPSNPDYLEGRGPAKSVPVQAGVHDLCVPHKDPQELFEQINLQIFGTPHPQPGQPATMQGFLVSYEQTKPAQSEEIMQCFVPEQLPVLSALARNFAVCDAWYASAPCQTWPNRAFFHLGTSCGHINNYPFDPFAFDVPTIFNVLQDQKISWTIYNDSILESATRLQFPQLWDLLLEPRFQGFDDFQRDAETGNLPAYSFVEPSFLFEPNDAHPPHDILLAEQFVWRVWQAVSGGAHWESTLLLITFDEHGGCVDHQPPPENAIAPDDLRSDTGFAFDRYGVRVPAIVVSPWIEPGTVFRSPIDRPFDHTSLLATLRDWLHLSPDAMLKSRRVASAPTLEHILTRSAPRREIPAIPYPAGNPAKHSMQLLPNDFQKGMLVSLAHRVGLRGGVRLLQNVHHRQHVADFFEAYKGRRKRKK